MNPDMQTLELILQESELCSQKALRLQVEANGLIKQQLHKLRGRLEETDKLSKANEIIRVLRNEVQTLQQQLELQRRTFQDITVRRTLACQCGQQNDETMTLGFVSPPNMFLSCTSEDDPAADIPVSPVCTVTSLQQVPLRVVTVKLADCHGMLGPDGVYKIPAQDGSHDGEHKYDKKGSYFSQYHDDGDDDDEDDGDDEYDHDYNPPPEGLDLDFMANHQISSGENIPNLLSLRKSPGQRQRTTHEYSECKEVFPFLSQLLVRQKTHQTSARETGQVSSDERSEDNKLLPPSSTHRYGHQRMHDKRKALSNAEIEIKTEITDKNTPSKHPFQCLVCGFRFKTKSTLLEHTAKHKGEKLIPCPYCHKKYKTYYLKTHIRSHTGERPFKCSVCGMTFASQSAFRNHKMRHASVKPNRCSQCGKTFTRPDALRSHLKVHARGEPLKCNSCGETHKYIKSLLAHQKREHDGEQSCSCLRCGDDFKTTDELRYHGCNQNGNGPYSDAGKNGPYSDAGKNDGDEGVEDNAVAGVEVSCDFDQCDGGDDSGDEENSDNENDSDYNPPQGLVHPTSSRETGQVSSDERIEGAKTSPSPSQLSVPQGMHDETKPLSDTEIETEIMNENSEISQSQSLLKTRKGTYSKTSDETSATSSGDITLYRCETCRKIFPTLSRLKAHVKIHTGLERPHVCTVCGKAFTHLSHFKIHSRKHTEERPYECTMCPKKFKTSSHVKAHIRIHTGERPYLCTQCGKRFHTSTALKSHQQSHSDERPYQCSQCDFRAKSKSVLVVHAERHGGERVSPCPYCHKNYKVTYMKTHIRSHTGERPFKCLQCGMTFASPSAFRNHKMVHASVKPNRCSQCGKSFTRPDALRNHLKVHARGEPYKCNICGETHKYIKSLVPHQRREHNGEQSCSCLRCGADFETTEELKSHECVQNINGRDSDAGKNDREDGDHDGEENYDDDDDDDEEGNYGLDQYLDGGDDGDGHYSETGVNDGGDDQDGGALGQQ